MVLNEHLFYLQGNRPDLYNRCIENRELDEEDYQEINKILKNANCKEIYNIHTGNIEENPSYNPDDPTNP
ncbi:MAG: hypothetical protein J6N45_05560 [Alphaproteobacteria bacterium]|nr:hypothetical protein [Alphaproteobacteria bacterium]